MPEPVLFVHHPSSLAHDPEALSPGHPDRPGRIAAIEAALAGASLPRLQRMPAPAATDAELELVHTAAHVRFVHDACRSGGGRLDADTVVGPASFTAAQHAAGGAAECVRALLGGRARTGFCALRPAGHHADRDRAQGFCLFNNVAIAAEMAVRELGAARVMIIDWDVHHGNGTAEIFRQRADVLVASLHQKGLYPGTGSLADAGSGAGSGYTINVPMPPFSDEEPWLSVLEYVLVPVGLRYAPELILVSAGYDAHRDDPLADCCLTSDSYAAMTAQVVGLASAVGAPAAFVLEGGYAPAALAASVLSTLAVLHDPVPPGSIAPDPIVTPQVASRLAHRWGL